MNAGTEFADTFPASIDVGGARLECRWLGPAPDAAPTLVLLHEGLGCVSTWGRFPERLAAATGCGVFVYSRAGYGRSDPITPPRAITYMHDEGLVVLPAVLERIGLRRGMLVGHSDGASISAIHAGGVRDARVRGVVLMAPHFFTEDMGIAGIARTVEAYGTTDLRAKLARHHGTNIDGAFCGWAQAWLDPAFRSWDIRAFLPAIEVPVLVIQGLDDAYGTLAQVDAAKALIGSVDERRAATVETVLLARCGHAPHHEAADTTCTAIAAFVARTLAARNFDST